MVYITTDLVLEILLRLPWTSLRRLRLVCRSWRNLVHERTTEMQKCRDAVPLVVTTESAYLLDLSSNPYVRRRLWRDDTDVYKRKEVVGVCNGVLCLCDDAKPGGVITLANPATGDVLELPPIPCAGLFRRHNTRRSARSWHQAYSFGYDHRTGLYKVVHVPCFFKIRDALHVFTLGGASWREIPALDAKCKLEAGVVSANGVTYWATDRCERIMSFDHGSERVACAKPLPNSVRARPICRLMEVRRRLSVAFATGDEDREVWILDRTRKDHGWVHGYNLLYVPSPGPSTTPARLNLVYGEYVLTVWSLGEKCKKLLRQQLLQPDDDMSKPEERKVVGLNCSTDTAFCRTFAYIRTNEALSVYRRW